jgi:peptide/nickel transport system permease protein
MPAGDNDGLLPPLGSAGFGTSRAVTLTDAPMSGPLPSAGGAGVPEGGEAGSTGSVWRLIGRVFIENKMAVVGLIILVAILVFCFLGPFFYHSDQTSQLLRSYAPPGGCKSAPGGVPGALPLAATGYTQPGPPCPLGTDGFGFDVLGRLMVAGQASLEVGFAAAAVATLFGVVYGAISGFFGGILDAFMMRFVDAVLSIPGLLLLIVFSVLFSPSKDVLIFVIAALAWLYPARLVRGETLTLRTREYVQAVRVMGGGGARIVGRHIIPNAIGTIVVNATFQVADAILALAALSFLSLGIRPPQTDWGQMLSNGIDYLSDGAWWLIIPAGACIVLVVTAFNLIGDALRDSLEVRLQQR